MEPQKRGQPGLQAIPPPEPALARVASASNFTGGTPREIHNSPFPTHTKKKSPRPNKSKVAPEVLQVVYAGEPWRPPLQEVAFIHGQSLKWHKGYLNFSETRLEDMKELGSGIYLYFYILLTFSGLFLLCSVCSLPSLFFSGCSNGLLVSGSVQGMQLLAQFSIGNIGTCHLAADKTTADCTRHLTLRLWNHEVHFPAALVAYLIGGLEFLLAVVWMLKVAGFSKSSRVIEKVLEEERLTAADYTVYVRGFPPDTSTDEVARHFNQRYDLSKPSPRYPYWGISIKGVSVLWGLAVGVVVLTVGGPLLSSVYGDFHGLAFTAGGLVFLPLFTVVLIRCFKVGKPKQIKTPEQKYDKNLKFVLEDETRQKKCRSEKRAKALEQFKRIQEDPQQVEYFQNFVKSIVPASELNAQLLQGQDRQDSAPMDGGGPVLKSEPMGQESTLVKPLQKTFSKQLLNTFSQRIKIDAKNKANFLTLESIGDEPCPPVKKRQGLLLNLDSVGERIFGAGERKRSTLFLQGSDENEQEPEEVFQPIKSPKRPGAVFTGLLGPTLYQASNSKVVSTASVEGRVIGLYLSRYTCSVCQATTPRLAKIYEAYRSKGLRFEIVFISCDFNQQNYKDYLAEMPWLALGFEDPHIKFITEYISGSFGLPTLLLINAKGELISRDGVKMLLNDPEGEAADWLVTAQNNHDQCRNGNKPDVKIYPSPMKHKSKVQDDIPRLVPPRPDCQPVSDTSNTDEQEYLGSWVADVRLVHPNGDIIRDITLQQEVLAKIDQAHMKIRKYETLGQLDKRVAVEKEIAELDKVSIKIETAMLQVDPAKLTQTSGAFVTFNNQESRQRCVDDYRCSSNWFCFMWQPVSLRFKSERHRNEKGKPKFFRIEVAPAPEPSNVLWENLEVSWQEALFRRTITGIFTLLLLSCSFAIIYAAQKYKSENQGADLSLCYTELPATFFGTYNFQSSNLTLELGNKDCLSGYVPLSFGYQMPPDVQVPGSPDLSSLVRNASMGLCDSGCYPTSGAGSTCQVLSCTVPEWQAQGHTCTAPYMESTWTLCFCKGAMEAATAKQGVISGLKSVYKRYKSACGNLAMEYYASYLLLALSALVVVLVNSCLNTVLVKLAIFERHSSVSAQAVSVTWKTALAQFLNTAVLTLIVNAKIDLFSENQFLQAIHLFDGLYTGFNREWYATIGASLTLTMLINALVPALIPLASAYVFNPLKRWWKNNSAVSQEQLNQLYEPPVFTLECRYGYLLNSVFVTMLYGAGLPLLYPIAAFHLFLCFAIDKYIIIRLNAQPPAYDSSLADLFIKLMPFAIIFHLAIGCYMLSYNAVLQSPRILNLNSMIDSDNSFWRMIAPDLLRSHVFPLFVLLLLYTFLVIAHSLLGKYLLATLRHVLGKAFIRCHRYVPKLEGLHARYTGPMLLTLPDNLFCHVVEQGNLPSQYLKQGWELVGSGIDPPLMKKTWKDVTFKDKRHFCGEQQLTWEYLAELGLYSYQLDQNPAYVRAMGFIHRFMAKHNIKRSSKNKLEISVPSRKSVADLESPKSPKRKQIQPIDDTKQQLKKQQILKKQLLKQKVIKKQQN